MLKTRVMPTMLHRGFGLVKGVGFDSWRPVGNVVQTIKVYGMREVDELVFLDISATAEGRRPDFELIDQIADECFVPFTVGGGITSVEDVRELLRVGADKVIVGTQCVDRPDIVTEGVREFGSQCIAASIDARPRDGGGWDVVVGSGSRPTALEPVELARAMEARGAGEILLTSIPNDGTMQGYDVDLIRAVAAAVSIPVIASGGAGNYEHMLAAIQQGGASAVAAASMFHFTQQTPLEAKKYLAAKGIPVRL